MEKTEKWKVEREVKQGTPFDRQLPPWGLCKN